MTSTCNAMRQCAQKLVPKFCASKRAKNTKTHPEKPKMGKTGCVLGAGEDENGCRQGQTDAKSRCLNKCEHHNHTTHVKRKPAETQCFRRFFGRGRRTRTLGTRFWSGCGNNALGTGERRCCAIPPANPKTGGACLVLCRFFPEAAKRVFTGKKCS